MNDLKEPETKYDNRRDKDGLPTDVWKASIGNLHYIYASKKQGRHQ